MASPRIYLTGSLAIENNGTLIDERHLPGRQGRLAFAYLLVNRLNPATRDDLVSVIWHDEAPAELESALSAILSKLRGAFKKAAVLDAAIDVRAGTIVVRLPADVRIDLEEAANAIDEAEGALRRGELPRAWGHANVAVAVARRPFLPNEEAPWIEVRRERLRALLSRGLQVLATSSAATGETSLAVQYASEMVDLEPFRETGYQQLMRLHAQLGNRGEALRVFGRCRELLREELGTSPSAQTEALFLEILRSE